MLGGTEFVGRAVVEAALGRGLGGDRLPPRTARGTARSAVAARRPHRVRRARRPGRRHVGRRRRHLVGGAGRGAGRGAAAAGPRRPVRVRVELLGVRLGPPPAGYTEDAPLVDGASADAGPTDYARDKRGAELAVLDAFGADRSVLVRAGLILGPYENIGRLPWWLNRVARGGPVLAPGPRDLPLQYVDVRDLADWTLGAVEQELSGPYNLVSPPGHTTMGDLLDACATATGGAAEPRWTAPETILAAGIEPWGATARVDPARQRPARRPAQRGRLPGAGDGTELPAGRRHRRRHLDLAAGHRRHGAPAPRTGRRSGWTPRRRRRCSRPTGAGPARGVPDTTP